MSPILPTLKIFVTVFALESQLFLSFCSFSSLWFTDEGKKIHPMLLVYERILSIPIPFGNEEMRESTEPGCSNLLDALPFIIYLYVLLLYFTNIIFTIQGVKRHQILSEKFP